MLKAVCFDDVLLAPQYSDINSRSDVNLSVTGFDENFARLTINHGFLTCPIVGSPMDTVTGPQSAAVLHNFGGFGVLHRYCTIENAVQMFVNTTSLLEKKESAFPNIMSAIGATADYMERAVSLYDAGCRAFCIDVAHGHHEHVKNALKNLRNRFGKSIHIMTGNVATLDAFNELADWGSDSIRVGVGGGCFIPSTLITMADGTKKSIQDVKIGESVITHTGEPKQVINLFERPFADLLVKINDTLTCTLNHEIYVIENKDIPNVNDENIHHFAKWIPAADLNENYSLVEII